MKLKTNQQIYIIDGIKQYSGKVVRHGKNVIRIKLTDNERISFKLVDVTITDIPECTINSHDLVHADDAGNGYHGNCKHCGLPFVTDLGYCSWTDTTCVDRIVTDESDIPGDVCSYARWKGYKWDYKKRKYVKATFSHDIDEATITDIQELLKTLTAKTSTKS